MDERDTTRRRYLGTLGLAGLAGVAGCLRVANDQSRGGNSTTAATETPGPGATGTSGLPDFGGYLDGANGYDGVVNRRGESNVTVSVGAGEGFAFDPPAIHVDAGTTVTWEWTGQGGGHNVVAEDGTFDSGEVVAEEGYTFAHTVEDDGIYTYYCAPHKALGMKGAVVVGDNYPTQQEEGQQEKPQIPGADYLSDANNYDGYVDARGRDEVVVDVGAGDGLSFDPAAIHVDLGATVQWRWTGEGGAHNVLAEDDSLENFDSGSPKQEGSFEYTVEEERLYRYHCEPHKASGMKATVYAGSGDLGEYAGTYEPDRSQPGPEFDSYLEDANGYDGSVVDERGAETVVVQVGAGEDGLAFGPAAVRVDPGATVVWEWTGKGGAHNVVAEDGTFDSGEVIADEGFAFEYTVEAEGTHLYYCAPHKAAGMKGAIVVGDG